MSDEEVVDPFNTAREQCRESGKCESFEKRLNKCNKRVTKNAGKTEETCFEELIDFVHCVDHCASKGLFKKLK